MGINLLTIKNLMGHKSIKMTERYVHADLEALKPAAAALDDYYEKRYNIATMERASVAK